MSSFRARLTNHNRVRDGDDFHSKAVQRLRMKAAGRRVMVLNQFVAEEAPAVSGVATSGAAFRIGRTAAAMSKSMRIKPAEGKHRNCCWQRMRRLFLGKGETLDERSKSYHTGHESTQQTKLEKRATAAIEGLHRHGVSAFSEDHELAMKTDALCDLVIKREAVLDDMALRVVAKHDIFTGGFYMFFFLLFFWVVVDQMQVWKRFDLEVAMKQYASEGPSSSGGIGGRRGGASAARASGVSEVKGIDDVFPWLENIVVGSVFPAEEWYNGDPFRPEEVGYVVNFNRLVGGFQLVQKRVAANVNCPHDERFGDWAGDCYSQYGDEWRMEGPFGPPHDPDKCAALLLSVYALHSVPQKIVGTLFLGIVKHCSTVAVSDVQVSMEQRRCCCHR